MAPGPAAQQEHLNNRREPDQSYYFNGTK